MKKLEEIKMEKLISSNIEYAGYSEEHGLIVKFKNGGVYRWEYVSKNTYVLFMQSESKGRFLHLNIKSQYECVKIDDIEKCGFILNFAKDEIKKEGDK